MVLLFIATAQSKNFLILKRKCEKVDSTQRNSGPKMAFFVSMWYIFVSKFTS